MIIEKMASQFEIFILSQDVNQSSEIKTTLEQFQFKVHTFTDLQSFMDFYLKQPAHIAIIDLVTIPQPIHDVVEKIFSVSQETIIVPLVPDDRMGSLQKYRKYNVQFVLSKSSPSIEIQLLNIIFAICENLYRTYQNEQFFDLLNAEKAKNEKLALDKSRELNSARVRPYQLRINTYREAETKEQLLSLFYKTTPQQSWIYLKFIDSIETFVAVSSHLAPSSWTEGLSFKVPKGEREFLRLLTQGELPASLQKYLFEKFDSARLKFLPLLLRSTVDGLLVTTQEISADVAEDFTLFSLVYSQIHFESIPKYLDVEDRLTGLYNELFYKRLLEKEVDRSKRSFSPLSVVRVSVDRFKEIEISIGKGAAEQVLKRIAEVLQKTSRLPDFICRVSESEFAIVLTHCNRKGAAVRAERLRVALLKESFVETSLKISVSQGISEYPSLTSSATDLDESAKMALDFIQNKGGDKMCIYKADPDHEPDFSVNV